MDVDPLKWHLCSCSKTHSPQHGLQSDPSQNQASAAMLERDYDTGADSSIERCYS